MKAQTIAILLSLVLATSSAGAYIVVTNNDDNNDDGIFSYVSLGASNTNGYGIHGYISDEEISAIRSGEVSKDEVNVYGYQRTPEGAYPDLIRDHYVEIYGEDKVTVDQLAISSMRVEELRILLDDTYDGDDYSEWRFTCPGGWFSSAEEGGMDALRLTYKEKITKADLVTVDIGWNNFGVYICNQLVDYIEKGQMDWSTDVTSIFDTIEEDTAAMDAKEIIRGHIVSTMGDNELSDALTDVFAYSLIGYMHNFDIVMEKIYELNPNVDVVTIGIQNLLHGAVVKYGDTLIPIGDIFGNFVNMANYYISVCSPYQDDYLYIKPGVDGHVNIFLDYIKDYDGDVDGLNRNVKDCFDYYDNDIHIQPMLDYLAASMLFEEYGMVFEWMGYESGDQAVAAGKRGELQSFFGMDIQGMFDDMYWPALRAAYDTLAVMAREIANMESIDVTELINGTFDMDAAESTLESTLMNEIIENAMAASEGKPYTVDMDKIMPDTATMLVSVINVRFYMGNSFFAHPDETGHMEIKNAVIQILDDPEIESDQELKDDLSDSVVEINQLLCGGSGHDIKKGSCRICGQATA